MFGFFKAAQGLSSLQLSNQIILTDISSNCEAKLNFVPEDAELVNLVAIFRHGDRAPLKITNPLWYSHSCIKCTQSICPEINCEDGLLTTKGFEQAKELGIFMKNNYLDKFKERPIISAFHSSINRSYSTLKGVLESLGSKVSSIEEESCLLSSSVAVSMKNLILNSKKYAKNKELFSDYYEFDKFVSSYCSEIPYDCSGASCNLKWIANRYNQQLKSSLELIEMARKNIVANGVIFGKFAAFLKAEINKNENFTLISGHDSNIIKTLQGLNIQIDAFPPYTGAIFLEVWRDSSNLKYVKVNYQGKEMNFGLYSEKRVTIDNFNKYLDIYVHSNKQIDEIVETKKAEGKLDSQEIKYLVEKAKEIYSFIKKDIDSNPLIKIASSLFGKINYFYSFFSSSIHDSRSFFFGWLKKNKEMIKVQTKSTDENGDEIISTLECDKNKKSDCKVLKTEKTGKKGSPNTKPQVISEEKVSSKGEGGQKDSEQNADASKESKKESTESDGSNKGTSSDESHNKESDSKSKNKVISATSSSKESRTLDTTVKGEKKEAGCNETENSCEKRNCPLAQSPCEKKEKECGCRLIKDKTPCDKSEKEESKDCGCDKPKTKEKSCDSSQSFFKGGKEKKFISKGCNVLDDDIIKQLLEKNRPIQTSDCDSNQDEKPEVPSFSQMNQAPQPIPQFKPMPPPITQPRRFFTNFFYRQPQPPCFKLNPQGVNVPCTQNQQFIQ